jgi:hypothetical protein
MTKEKLNISIPALPRPTLGGDKPGHEGKQSTNKGTTTMGYYSNKAGFGNKWVAPPPGLKQKDLVGIPWRVAFALQADGWYLRQDIIWAKPNPMPESVTDRCTKSHEYIFLMSKNGRYYFDNEAIKEPVAEVSLKRAEYGWDCDRPSTKNGSIHTEKMGKRFVNPDGRNKRSVWTITTKPSKDAHFATFPEDLIVPMVKAGCPAEVCKKCGRARERITSISYKVRAWRSKGEKQFNTKESGARPNMPFMGDKIVETKGFTDCRCGAGFEPGLVLDPFMGSGTTGLVAKKLGRHYLGIELNPKYVEMAEKRIGRILL